MWVSSFIARNVMILLSQIARYAMPMLFAANETRPFYVLHPAHKMITRFI